MSVFYAWTIRKQLCMRKTIMHEKKQKEHVLETLDSVSRSEALIWKTPKIGAAD